MFNNDELCTKPVVFTSLGSFSKDSVVGVGKGYLKVLNNDEGKKTPCITFH